MSWKNKLLEHPSQETVTSDESESSFQSESVPHDKSISNTSLSDNAYLHSGNDGYQDDITRCKEKHVNNRGQEIEHCTRRKRRPPIRNEDFLWE